MKTFVKTLLWLVLLVAVIAGLARSYLLPFWNNREALIQQQAVKTLRDLLPDAKIELGELRYDFGREISITGFSLRPPGQDVPIITLPKTVMQIDRDALIERQQLEIRKVVLRTPKLEVIRDRNGKWNWQSLLPPEMGKGALPEIAIEDGTVTVRVEQALGIPAGVLILEHVDISLVPSGKRQFLITATSKCEHTGSILMDGRWHVDQHTGQIDGTFTEINAGQELVGVAASFAPEIRSKLEDWEAKFWELLSRPTDANSGSPFSVSMPAGASASPARGESGLQLGSADSILGLKATANLRFRCVRPEPNTTPTFRVLMQIVQGEVTNPILPFPLKNLTGELYADNDSFRVRKLSGQNGATKVLINGELSGRDAGYPGKFEVWLANVVCDARLRSRLSAGFGRLYDQHHPNGQTDLHAFLVHDPDGKWRPEGLEVTAKDCSLTHDAFPYPIENANGTIRQEGRDLIIEASGSASGRPITLEGTVTDPGPNASLMLNIRVNDLPLDETFLSACKPDIQAALRKMRLTGVMDGHVRLTKAAKQPIIPTITAVLRDGTMVYEAFPYRIDNLSGRVNATGISHWEFSDLTGQHGSSRLSAKGTFAKSLGPGELKLRVVTEQAPLDESLFRAIPTTLQRVWRDLAPTGMVDVVTELRWVTNQSFDLRLPNVEWSNGSLTLKSLPYRLDKAHGSFTYGPGEKGQPKLVIQSFEGHHGEMATAVSGFQTFDPNGNWKVHFDKFAIRDLTPNAELLASLAAMPGLRQVFENLDPHQTLRMDGVMDLRGTPDPADAITAAWDLDTYFNNGTIHTGLDLKDLKGKVSARGEWDGENAKLDGFVSLESARILDYVLNEVRGPYRVQNGVLMFGAADIERVRPPQALDPNELLTAKLFGGIITLGGAATLTAEPRYQVLMNLKDARLERFAALHAPQQTDLRGIVNGWINLKGKGSSPRDVTGKGQIQISPAALLNVPVVLQMYRSLSLATPEDSTFNYALFDFDVRNAAFDFSRIFLDGDKISFRGRGRVTFNNDVNLDFYSMLPRRPLSLPIIDFVVDEATKGWVGIKVRGKLDNPKTEVKAVPLLDDTLKLFLGTLPQPAFPIRQGLRPRGKERQ